MYHKNANKKQKMCSQCPLAGPNMPVTWASIEHRVGIHSPPSGHPQNKHWATSARVAGNVCPKIGANLGQYRQKRFADRMKYLVKKK